ncbi:MAG: B12-binding domain-containing protein [Rudaea sp.]
MTEQEQLQEIAEAVIGGNAKAAAAAVQRALSSGIEPLSVLNTGLMRGAEAVGAKFEQGEYFLPELMLSGRALKAAMEIVKPSLLSRYSAADGQIKAKVVVATVQTDIHDIGKNIVASMLTASGFQVTDLGVDVPIKTIADKAEEIGAQIIACSSLLTTSMPFMQDLVQLLTARGVRDRYIVIVGGPSVTEGWAKKIGADGTARNAASAVQLARHLFLEREQHA